MSFLRVKFELSLTLISNSRAELKYFQIFLINKPVFHKTRFDYTPIEIKKKIQMFSFHCQEKVYGQKFKALHCSSIYLRLLFFRTVAMRAFTHPISVSEQFPKSSRILPFHQHQQSVL